MPETMGGAGVVFRDKAFEHLTELIDLLLDDPTLRQRIIDGQRSRAQAFLEPQVRLQFIEYLRRGGVC
mgnify:CR=1 FL=1